MKEDIMNESERKELEILRIFYKEIIDLTMDHDVIEYDPGESSAVVYPSKIDKALSKVNPRWWQRPESRPDIED